jgi:hypothetical protein
MSYSTIAKDKGTGKEVRLLLNNNQLIVIESTSNNQSSTVETKEIFDLEFVYGVDYDDNKDGLLKINIIEQEQDKKVNSSDDKKTLRQKMEFTCFTLYY